MRIAYLTNQYARASDTFIRNEVVELRARGHVVETFSIRRPPDDAVIDADVAAERATTCYILSIGRLSFATTVLKAIGVHPGRAVRGFLTAMRLSQPGLRARAMHFFYFLEAVYLATRLRALRIDILHNHIAENSATVALLASELSDVPFSMTVHGPGIFFHPAEWALGTKIARAAFTACITDFCKSQCMLHSRLADWPKLSVVRCGVGRLFEAAVPVPPPAAPRLLFVGRLCEEKGLPLLIDAVARRVRAGGRIELAIVGDGPLRGYVQAFVEQHRLSAAITLLGWRGSADIVDELQRSRALVLPSFAEGLPVVIMEALALGRPVIATAIAGIPELVRDGENGWSIPAGSVEALEAAIGNVVDAPVETLRTMGLRGARRVGELHSLAAEVTKLEALLTAAAATRRRPDPRQSAGRVRSSPVAR